MDDFFYFLPFCCTQREPLCPFAVLYAFSVRIMLQQFEARKYMCANIVRLMSSYDVMKCAIPIFF